MKPEIQILNIDAKEKSDLLSRIEPLLTWVDENLGPTDPDFDIKAFCDEMWGED